MLFRSFSSSLTSDHWLRQLKSYRNLSIAHTGDYVWRELGGDPKKNPRDRFDPEGFKWKSPAVSYFHWKYNQLSSAQRRFTVLFGMGRSGTATLWSPGLKGGGKVKHSSFGLRCSHYPIRLKSSLNFSVQGFTVIGSSFTSN